MLTRVKLISVFPSTQDTETSGAVAVPSEGQAAVESQAKGPEESMPETALDSLEVASPSGPPVAKSPAQAPAPIKQHVFETVPEPMPALKTSTVAVGATLKSPPKASAPAPPVAPPAPVVKASTPPASAVAQLPDPKGPDLPAPKPAPQGPAPTAQPPAPTEPPPAPTEPAQPPAPKGPAPAPKGPAQPPAPKEPAQPPASTGPVQPPAPKPPAPAPPASADDAADPLASLAANLGAGHDGVEMPGDLGLLILNGCNASKSPDAPAPDAAGQAPLDPKVNTSTNRPAAMRLNRFMESSDANKFPHMQKLFNGTKEDTRLCFDFFSFSH